MVQPVMCWEQAQQMYVLHVHRDHIHHPWECSHVRNVQLVHITMLQAHPLHRIVTVVRWDIIVTAVDLHILFHVMLDSINQSLVQSMHQIV